MPNYPQNSSRFWGDQFSPNSRNQQISLYFPCLSGKRRQRLVRSRLPAPPTVCPKTRRPLRIGLGANLTAVTAAVSLGDAEHALVDKPLLGAAGLLLGVEIRARRPA